MVLAFNDGGREFHTEDIMMSLTRQIPLSKSQAETIDALRAWLTEGRVQSASYLEALDARRHFVNPGIPETAQ